MSGTNRRKQPPYLATVVIHNARVSRTERVSYLVWQIARGSPSCQAKCGRLLAKADHEPPPTSLGAENEVRVRLRTVSQVLQFLNDTYPSWQGGRP